jgi:hypothetical protein
MQLHNQNNLHSHNVSSIANADDGFSLGQDPAQMIPATDLLHSGRRRAIT